MGMLFLELVSNAFSYILIFWHEFLLLVMLCGHAVCITKIINRCLKACHQLLCLQENVCLLSACEVWVKKKENIALE